VNFAEIFWVRTSKNKILDYLYQKLYNEPNILRKKMKTQRILCTALFLIGGMLIPSIGTVHSADFDPFATPPKNYNPPQPQSVTKQNTTPSPSQGNVQKERVVPHWEEEPKVGVPEEEGQVESEKGEKPMSKKLVADVDPPQEKSSPVGPWITIVLIILVIASGAGVLFYYRKENSPQRKGKQEENIHIPPRI
jgi:hypothetical protein